uniref:Uncharacterized protein n=1 Tax=Anguilla anguilla TaxID=7936 RepID=A0A0E9RLR3_ANGAN
MAKYIFKIGCGSQFTNLFILLQSVSIPSSQN